MRIAMWSGPRNLSTALMYSFAARDDFAVVDEPFYAAYLHKTGLNHPMREEIIASQPIDYAEVVSQLCGSVPAQKPHFYQKHMTQHMLPDVPRDWILGMQNVFLIRHPARVAASFSAKYGDAALEDIGFAQQAALYDMVVDHGQTPLVIDSADIRCNPEEMLRRLCEALDLPWDAAMLSWHAGGSPADGIWSAHWYGAVHRSTGFAGPEGEWPSLTPSQQALSDAALPFYERLSQHKL